MHELRHARSTVEADRMIGEPEVALHSPAFRCKHTAEPRATAYENLCARTPR